MVIYDNKKKCRLCQKWRLPSELVGAPQRGYHCVECLQWHFHALDVLAGNTPRGCQVCNKTAEELMTTNAAGETVVRLFCHPKDGIYQLLCAECSTPYALKRADLYGQTAYGKELKL